MKARSTTAKGPEFKNKNSEGRSHKHIDGPRSSHGGGDDESARSAKRFYTAKPTGPAVKDRQAPHKQREVKEVVYVPEGRLKVEQWCHGQRRSYK